MNMQAAVRDAFARYFDFQGRSGRAAFWWTILFVTIVSAVLTAIDTQVLGYSTKGVMPLSNLFGLLTFIPLLALDIRRLHDTGRSGWWLLIILVPVIGFIVLIVFWVKPSEPGNNAFGPEPVAG